MLQVAEVLQRVEEGNLLPPLVVLSILAKNSSLQLSTVKGYIARQLTAESSHIQENRTQIAKYQQETSQMRADIKELRTQVSLLSALPCCSSQAVDQSTSQSCFRLMLLTYDTSAYQSCSCWPLVKCAS